MISFFFMLVKKNALDVEDVSNFESPLRSNPLTVSVAVKTMSLIWIMI